MDKHKYFVFEERLILPILRNLISIIYHKESSYRSESIPWLLPREKRLFKY